MKKIFSFILVLGLLLLVFQFSITLFKDSHSITYEIMAGDKNVKIVEEYIKTKHEEYYLFNITLDNKVYIFETNNNFNKQEHVIDNFKIYEEDELTCLSPIYIKNNDDPQILCNDNGIQVSYSKIMEEYNLTSFTNTLENYDSKKYESNNTKVSLDKNYIYKENLHEDEYLIVYNYKDLIKISNDVREKIKFSNYDIYHNEMGILIDKYYILPIFENKPEYSGMLIIDILSKAKETIEFKNKISTNLYVNGVVDNKLYFFDKSNFIQYEVNPSKRNYRIVGNKQTNAQYFNGEWSTRNIYDFYSEKIVFKEELPIKESYIDAFETSKCYYYYNDNNEFYKVYKRDLEHPILLFEYDNIKEIKVINNYVYFIYENTIYRYDDTGIKPMVTNNEFNYNYENIYGVYYK